MLTAHCFYWLFLVTQLELVQEKRDDGKNTGTDKIIIPKYKTLNREVADNNMYVKVSMDLLVSGEISKPGLKAMLEKLNGSEKNKKGFKFNQHPTDIYIYAYTSRELAQAGMGQWIAMSRWNNKTSKPNISYNDMQIEQLGVAPEKRFGLSEEMRRKIYKEIVSSHDKALEEAEDKYPIDPTQSLYPGQSIKLSKETPLMPELEPKDAIEAISKIKRLPAGTSIEVVKVAKIESTKWYNVKAKVPSRNVIETGWINSIALIGQVKVDFEEQLNKQGELSEKMKNKYEGEISKKHGLTREQLKQILNEGGEKDWPLPE